ncbi:MAG: T9SS type A sorting domain-containing protein [Melioribacteraceae bacterium]
MKNLKYFLIVTILFQGLILGQATYTFQEGVDGYSGSKSSIFSVNTHAQNVSDTDMFCRYDDSQRYYNLVYFDLGDMSGWGDITDAKLIFYKSSTSGIFQSGEIYLRKITDPDNLGMWEEASSDGYRNGGNKESRNDLTSPDVKWQNSDPSTPEDLNADYFKDILGPINYSNYFLPVNANPIGTAYELDVTSDIIAFKDGSVSNQGWTTWHADNVNLQKAIATSKHANSSLRPKLVIETGALPVELTTFTASIKDGKVSLIWETATEVNNYGFEIQKQNQVSSIENQDKSQSWESISFIEGHGNSNSPKYYEFNDNSTTSGKYFYRLKQIDIDGSFEYSKTVEVDLGVPTEFELSQNYPNPFNPTTNIKYSIPNVGGNENISSVQLKVFDVLGNEVATLVNKNQEAGSYKVNFDASNLTSGIYFYTLSIGDFLETKKMILLR